MKVKAVIKPPKKPASRAGRVTKEKKQDMLPIKENLKNKKSRTIETAKGSEVDERSNTGENVDTKIKKDWKPNLPQVLESQMKEEEEEDEDEEEEEEEGPKWKITTKQLQQFFGLKDYPIIINQLNRKLWEDKQKFRQFYLPLAYLFNPGVHLLLIEAYLEAKWREVMAWDQ